MTWHVAQKQRNNANETTQRSCRRQKTKWQINHREHGRKTNASTEECHKDNGDEAMKQNTEEVSTHKEHRRKEQGHMMDT